MPGKVCFDQFQLPSCSRGVHGSGSCGGKRDGSRSRACRGAAEVALERARQEQLAAQGKILHTAAARFAAPGWQLGVLTEEVGEAATEVQRLYESQGRVLQTMKARMQLRAELIQVAAVAVAWAESLEVPS